MRNAFAEELASLAVQDSRIVLLSGDIGNRLFDRFKEAAPDRFYNCGVAEANMTGVAAGMALTGLRPFTYSIAPFATVRCLEQIRVDICYHNVPVTIVGTGAGLSYAGLGPTHHSCDDIGLLRMLPNITIVCPSDPVEARLAVGASLQHDGPVYLRLGKKGEPPIHKADPEFVIGKPITVREGEDVCILSTGSVLALSLLAADEMRHRGFSARVESFHTVKPLAGEWLEKVFHSHRAVVTVEEHSLIGGLGGAVAEWLAGRDIPGNRLLRFGTKDIFVDEIGSREYIRKRLGLSASGIAADVVRAVESSRPEPSERDP